MPSLATSAPCSGATKKVTGETPYAAGYIEHYLDGKLWPQGATPIVEKVGFAIVVISYLGFFVVRHRRRAAGQAKVRGDSVGPRT